MDNWREKLCQSMSQEAQFTDEIINIGNLICIKTVIDIHHVYYFIISFLNKKSNFI